ncbi:unnamed protein product [Ilex paraguariensis]|uniref:Uncharacterized protein n=1 Tax=Ilex paraguariensis TaxID=185542 RepID=A0ABC8TNN2_9AQUA
MLALAVMSPLRFSVMELLCITSADTALSKTLGTTVKIFTTSLGESYSEYLNAACNLITARGDWGGGGGGTTNAQSLCLKIEERIPVVPVIIGLRNALLLEQPSAFQHQFAKSAEKERSHMTELEYQMINMGTKKLVTE